MELIEGHVRTNVDRLQRAIWPRWFYPNIQVGHYIMADSGHQAKITRITHASADAKPYLIIEVWAEPKT